MIREEADFYVDDHNLILESLNALATPLDETKFRIESVGFRQYSPLFSTSERGGKLRKTFEDGMNSLAAQGKLLPIYERWNLPMPRVYQK